MDKTTQITQYEPIRAGIESLRTRQRAQLAKAEAESRRVREAQEAKERAEFEKAEAEGGAA